ncbi:MAG: thiol-disulfide oxidoreductase [Ignavibacteriales bacterium CG_4_9_14_3_um_filter_30_11]|nr:MAG: thiol-disulfide oxidoreductase [Ignavibacteriales bacterium CG_4_9_14_3_um_filter_30_11]
MLIFFDGVCNLCNSSVNFIIKRDKNEKFKFVSFQSSKAAELLNKYNYTDNKLDTLVLLKNNTIFAKSTAALLISKELNSFWKIFYIFIIIPKFIRDFVYLYISKNRYKWFGKKDFCMIPSPDISSRFLS